MWSLEPTWWLFTMTTSFLFPPNVRHVAGINNTGWNEKTVTTSLIKCSSCRPLFMLSTCQIVRCQGNYLLCFSTSRTVYHSHVLFCLLPNKTDGAYPHQPLGENPPNSHFFFVCCKLSKDSPHIKVESRRILEINRYTCVFVLKYLLEDWWKLLPRNGAIHQACSHAITHVKDGARKPVTLSSNERQGSTSNSWQKPG